MLITSIVLLTLFLATCIGITYYILNKKDKAVSPLKKKPFWFISAFYFLLTVLLFPFVVLFSMMASSYVPSKDFNSNDWKLADNKRIELVDDLLERKLLGGLSKTEVISMLGKPLDNCNYFLNSKKDMIYYLGPECSIISIDSEWLLIWLENDKVVKYEVWRD